MFDGLWKPRGDEKGKSQRTVLRGLSKGTGGDVAQLVERRTGTPLTQVRISGAARDFSPRVNFQCGLSLVCPYSPRVQSHALTYMRTLKTL